MAKEKVEKIVLATFLVILAVFAAIAAVLEYSVYREISTPLEVLNAADSKTALVIYHPGLTSFAHDIAYNFSNGLASAGWRVEIATASPQAPTNIANYSLLVLCWPIYDFNPGLTITNQIHRIGNLNGIKTVIVAVGGGMDPFSAPANMDKTVQNANGTIIQTIRAFRSTHNLNLQGAASKISS